LLDPRVMGTRTTFLLSPASCGGRRAALLFRPGAEFDLAKRLAEGGTAPLGEVFCFLSGLYFRGKLAYADRFADRSSGVPGVLVITPSRGLLTPETPVDRALLEEFARTPVDPRESRYYEPLLRDLDGLALAASHRVVLLGSIATGKYLEMLLDAFGPRVCFPASFVGIGDMSRGAMMLRAAASGEELSYVPALGAVRSRASASRSAPR
jgi:hypothetical protein